MSATTMATAVTLTLTTDQEQSKSFTLEPGESVLSALLRHGVAVPNSCRAGACQSCMMRATAGTPTPDSQKGLKDAQRVKGLFLACACVPTSDLTVRFADGDTASRAKGVIRRVDRLSHDVARVLIETKEPVSYFPGQFLNLVRSDGLVRSYSLASLHSPAGVAPGDDALELHVRRVRGGQMSEWLHGDDVVGETVELHGPMGDCFYVAGRPEQPILLIGTGTGLAPLYAIVRDALRHGHTGPIRLYHGARGPAGLYLIDELRALAARHTDFAYTPCVLEGPADDAAVRVGPIDQVVLADTPKLTGHRVFLCGDPTIVTALRKRVFLAGANMKDIYADAFVMRASS